MKSKSCLYLLAWLAVTPLTLMATPLGTAFTYQGRLKNSAPANGPVALSFSLWDAPTGGINVGTPLVLARNANAANWVFSVDVDFGAAAFTGNARWLEIRINGVLEPTRMRVAPTPNAIYASTAGTANAVAAEGPSYLRLNNLYFGTDASHGAGYRGTFAGQGIDGPVLFGYGGGGLGSTVPDVLALSWNRSGNVGIGTTSPQARLHVNGTVLSGQANTISGNSAAVGGGEQNQASASYGTIGGGLLNQVSGTGSGTVSGGALNIASGNAATVPGGDSNLAQGRNSFAAGRGARALHDGAFVWADRQGLGALVVPFESTEENQFSVRALGGARFASRFLEVVGDGNERAYIGGDGTGNDIQVGSLNPSVTDIFMYNAANGTHMHTHVGVLTIHGGSDLAEPFPMKEAKIDKGSVVVIDDEHPGRLKRSTQAYDTRVAGIVSGANGINPGIALKQEGALDQGENVALTGRVYVKADASHGPIKPGDLLTTSDTPGHAMKVTNHAKSQGAILGKAMSALQEGTGLVLVLVMLQ